MRGIRSGVKMHHDGLEDGEIASTSLSFFWIEDYRRRLWLNAKWQTHYAYPHNDEFFRNESAVLLHL
jgi:hypothetical protein